MKSCNCTMYLTNPECWRTCPNMWEEVNSEFEIKLNDIAKRNINWKEKQINFPISDPVGKAILDDILKS